MFHRNLHEGRIHEQCFNEYRTQPIRSQVRLDLDTGQHPRRDGWFYDHLPRVAPWPWIRRCQHRCGRCCRSLHRPGTGRRPFQEGGRGLGSALAEFIADGLDWMGVRGWTGLTVGLFVGVAQGIVLGLRSTLGSWVIVNVIGYALGYALGYGIPILLSICPGGQPLAVPMIGLGVGLVSWLVLHRAASTVSMAKQ